MDSFIELVKDILDNGEFREDRTGVGTYSVFGRTIEFDLRAGFPALTTKKLAFKGVLSELLWFLEGSGDERRLAEILYNKPRSELTDKSTIWTGNANASSWLPHATYEGDLGRPYGVQWRDFRNFNGESIDQVARLIDGIKSDPYSRRHLLSAWNPAELHLMALPPCHVMVQYYVSTAGELHSQFYMRSNDVGLGLGFNIASYALLQHMIAQVCGLSVGTMKYVVGDAHIYSDHVEPLKEQIARTPYELPTLKMNTDVSDIFAFTMDDFELIGYNHHPTIKMKMAV